MNYTKLSKIVAIAVAAVILAGAAVFFIFGSVRGGAAYNGGYEAVYTTTCENASAIAKAVKAETGITPVVKVSYKAEGGFTGNVKLVFDGIEITDDQLAKVDAAMASVDAAAARTANGAVKGTKTVTVDVWAIVISLAVVVVASFIYSAIRFKKAFGTKASVLSAISAIAAPAFAFALSVLCRVSFTEFTEYLVIAVSIAAAVVSFVAFELIIGNKAAGTAKPFSDEVVNGSVCTLSKLIAIPAAVICIAVAGVIAAVAISGFAVAASAAVSVIFAIIAAVAIPLYAFAPMIAKN